MRRQHPTLAAAFAPGELDRLLPAVHRFDLELRTRATLREAAPDIRSSPFELIMVRCSADLAALKFFVASIRAPGSASTRAGILLLAPPELLERTSYLVGRGANKLLSLVESADVVRCVVTGLVAAHTPLAERLTVRYPIRLRVDGQWRSWRTENLSASGMLIRGPGELKVGARCPFVLDLPGSPISGELKVMRVTTADSEPVAGFGVRFCSFDGLGRRRLGEAMNALRKGSR